MKPTLDMSDVLASPEFNDSIRVIRRRQVTSNTGRVSYVDTTFDDVAAVICSATPNDLERLPEAQRTYRTLSVVSRFKLQATSPGYNADIIVWQGDSYVVAALDPYQRYGNGFVQVLAQSMDSQDRSPAAGVGEEKFNNPSNSNLLGQ